MFNNNQYQENRASSGKTASLKAHPLKWREIGKSFAKEVNCKTKETVMGRIPTLPAIEAVSKLISENRTEAQKLAKNIFEVIDTLGMILADVAAKVITHNQKEFQIPETNLSLDDLPLINKDGLPESFHKSINISTKDDKYHLLAAQSPELIVASLTSPDGIRINVNEQNDEHRAVEIYAVNSDGQRQSASICVEHKGEDCTIDSIKVDKVKSEIKPISVKVEKSFFEPGPKHWDR